ncbi:MAG: hypothetical protein GY796_19635 [Chloroflexi bacterium]|nr:hypothetical protein [Chloroflexota bacterium]
MSILFGTDEWVKALMVELNNSPGYASAAKKWEGDFYFVINQGDGMAEETYLYMDLWHGKCRDAFKVDDAGAKSPAFELRAPIKTWKSVVGKKTDPIRGLMTGKLKMKGPMVKVMKTPKAAIELVEACSRLDTDWPS